MAKVTTVGIDLAKHVFSVHGVDESGKTVLRRTVSRARLTETIAQLPSCLIGMEACTGAHQWAREFERLGHTVKLMAPKFVAPYRKNGKNDGNDAEAICEAVARPNMRFVPIKTIEQQAMIALHRVRQGYVEERTGLIKPHPRGALGDGRGLARTGRGRAPPSGRRCRRLARGGGAKCGDDAGAPAPTRRTHCDA